MGRKYVATMMHALVTCRLGYSCLLSWRMPLKSIQKLHLVQSAASRKLTGMGHRDSINPVLACLPVCFWVQFKVLMLTFKALYNLGPAYLKNSLLTYEFPDHFSYLLRPCFGCSYLLRLGRWQPERRPSSLWHKNCETFFSGRLICPLLLPSCSAGWRLFCFLLVIPSCPIY